jgi:trans-2-enoyl-CoA reductase
MPTVVPVKETLAITYSSHGKPADVLTLGSAPLAEPGADTATIRLLAAVIQPSDIGMILGKYGKLPPLPAVAGREGVGVVEAVGEKVSGLQPGDWVRMPEEAGVWRTQVVAPAADLFPIPNDIPLEMAAMAFINPPTAWRILRDAHLNSGDWLIQNAANSAVGQFVIQMARHLDLKTINVVRRPELIEPLKALGADAVVLEDSGYEKKIAEITGGAAVQLGLNSVGGESAARLVRALGFKGTLVTFGAMTFEPIRFPTRELIFNQIQLTGFWLDRWYRESSRERIQVMQDKIHSLMRSGSIVAPVADRFPLSRFREALAASEQPRLGKILLLPDDKG